MMKKAPRSPRAALFIGAALLSTSFAHAASAQDVPVPQAETPPPVQITPAPAPAPATPVIEMAPSAPVVQTVPETTPAQPETATTTKTVRTATRAASPRQAAPVRQTTRTTTTRSVAPAATAPVVAPVTQAAAPVAPAPTAQPVAQPAPAAETAAPAEVAPARTIPWAWVIGGLLVALAAAALLLTRRRREEPDYVEETAYEPVTRVHETPVAPVYEEPVAPPAYEAPVVAPRHEPEVSPLMVAAAAPVLSARNDESAEAHTEAELAEPESEDLAGVTDAPAPVANRPWLEFGLRPVRAGTSEEEALVDVELTVGNAGDVPARDVRISTFMLADAEASEMESLLAEHRADAAVPPVTIAPGDGTRVDAHLAVPKGEMGRVFNPVVVAEARYTLPDGREGRTSAAFKIGRPSEVADGVGPIGATRPHMVDDVEAELLGVPEHA